MTTRRELALEEIASAAYFRSIILRAVFKQIPGVTPHVYLGT